MSSPPEILDIEQAADYLRLSVGTLEKLKAAGTGPVYCQLTPRRVVYHIDDLRAFVIGKRVEAATDGV
jgi:hypothetical protein